MLRFSQSNELPSELLANRPMPCWSDQSSAANDFADEIDAIMKHEHQDVILLDHSLPETPLDLDLDSISDLLENQSAATAPTSFTQPLTINDFSASFIPLANPQSQSNTTTSAYSSLGISPKFTTLSIHPPSLFSFAPASIPQSEPTILATSYPFPFPNQAMVSSDVKRFRSASMNEGSTVSQTNDTFDPYRFKPSNYVHRLPHQNGPRPVSNSFSEADSIAPTRFTSNDVNVASQTLYSLNHETITPPPTRKRLSFVDFPVEEIKDDPVSPNTTIEAPSDADLWSDIEQNSSEALHENEMTSEEDTRTSGEFHPDASNSNSNGVNASLFWQYNVQSKGPKTKRILYLKERDPHLHREFSDPVYQIKLTQNKGQNLNKLRKGDGNDVTPNPMKLYQLGKQIRDLSSNPASLYHGIYHADQHHHVHSNDTAEVKKEKNKLASRACRLRKKAQHEANKLKLHGLNEEHKGLNDVIASMKLCIVQRYQNGARPKSSSLEAILDQLIANKCTNSVAGNGDGYVQTIVNEMEHLHSFKQRKPSPDSMANH